MSLVHETLKIVHVAVLRVHFLELGDVVAVIAQRGRIEGQQPDRVDAQLLHIVEPLHQPLEVADPVAVAVLKRLDVNLVDDRVLVPVGTGLVGHGSKVGLGIHHQVFPGAMRRQIA